MFQAPEVWLAAVVEAGKLFVAGQRPDPTNLFIAVSISALVLCLGSIAGRTRSPSAPSVSGSGSHTHRGAGVLAGFAWLAIPAALAWAWLFPAFALPLLGLLILCVAVVWRRPVLALAIVPAALPVLDLAPWSGRFFWTEFDLLLAVCLAVPWLRTPAPGLVALRSPTVTLAFALLGLSLLASTARALLTWPGIDDNSFASYFSAFNALRIVKGALGRGCSSPSSSGWQTKAIPGRNCSAPAWCWAWRPR